jgi:tetratricopeptide (TPR) repeat protein
VEEIDTRATALAMQRDFRCKREAIKILEEFHLRRRLPDDDLFLLAELHNLVGNWPRAREILVPLVKANDNPVYIRYLAFNLILHSEAKEADKWVTLLEKSQPDTIQTVELRARVLAASGETSKASDILMKQAEKPNAPRAVIARLLEDVGAQLEADKILQRLVVDSRKPDARLALAEYYGRQNRTVDALRICEAAWNTVPPEKVTSSAVYILYLARDPLEADIKRVIGWLDQAIRNNSLSPTLLTNMAAVLNLKGDYRGAISYYRKLVDIDRNDVLAPNNLAYLLSASEKRYDDALKVLDRAKSAFGRLPTLLDTEAQVYIAKKEPDKAITLLEQAIEREPKGSYYFHLAQAYLASEKQPDAKTAWDKARNNFQLKPADLHFLEREAYKKLAEELGT